MRKSLPCSEVLPPPGSCREAASANAVAEELCRSPAPDCETCDCAAEKRPCCCCSEDACEVGLRCEEDAEDGRPPPAADAELRSDAELASSIWRSLGVDKFFLILWNLLDVKSKEPLRCLQTGVWVALSNFAYKNCIASKITVWIWKVSANLEMR